MSDKLNHLNINEKRFVFIVGQPKAGTSSLFNWLIDHPEISGSIMKETRFFLDPDYPLPSRLRFDGKNLDEYLKLFARPEASVYLEATPDYLYCYTPVSLKKVFPNSYCIILERDPVERLLSSFKYFKQQGLIPDALSFENYVREQYQKLSQPNLDYAYRSLEHSRRSYIKRYIQSYNERCLIIDFKLLKERPEKVLQMVCDFIGVDAKCVKKENYKIFNQTKASNSIQLTKTFRFARRKLSYMFVQYPRIRSILQPISRILQKLLYKKSGFEDDEIISSEIRALIYEISET